MKNYILSANLKDLRDKNKGSQKTVANKLNIAVSSISKFETGMQEPTTQVLLEYAKIFNVSLDDLINIEDLANLTDEQLQALKTSKVATKNDGQIKEVVIKEKVVETITTVVHNETLYRGSICLDSTYSKKRLHPGWYLSRGKLILLLSGAAICTGVLVSVMMNDPEMAYKDYGFWLNFIVGLAMMVMFVGPLALIQYGMQLTLTRKAKVLNPNGEGEITNEGFMLFVNGVKHEYTGDDIKGISNSYLSEDKSVYHANIVTNDGKTIVIANTDMFAASKPQKFFSMRIKKSKSE